MRAGTRLQTGATTRGRCKHTLGTATSNTPCDTLSCRRRGSRISGESKRPAERSIVSLSTQLAADLAQGTAYGFRDWPNAAVPTFGAGVYTIWHRDGRFIYVGMSGRGITSDTVHRNAPRGMYTRLQSHSSGRRRGDHFCVYVADRLVLPTLSRDDITAIASGCHQLDAFVRRYIHENLCYRFAMLPDGATAYTAEAAIKSGRWEHGRPLLNPGR
jgi:hypothetical protein